MTSSTHVRAAAVSVPAALALLLACSDATNGTPRLAQVIGDIEPTGGTFCGVHLGTLPTANSIRVPDNGLPSAAADTTPNLVDVTGAATALTFVFDTGGQGFGVAFCGRGGSLLEDDGVSANGPVLHKRWYLDGLVPGAAYTMAFTAGGRGTPRRSGRIFVDVNGNGTIEAGEVADLIGLDGTVETRTFPQPVTAGPTGRIRGEWWGGSTNGTGENGAWEGWSIVSAP